MKLSYVIGIVFIVVAAMTTDAIARERFTGEGGEACVGQSTFDASGNETIDMFCCGRGQVMLADESCMDSTMLDFFRSSFNFVMGGLFPPGGGMGGGAGNKPPGQPGKPTKEQCQAAGRDCQSKCGGTQRACESALIGGIISIINPGVGTQPGTCYGNTEDVLRRIRCREDELSNNEHCRTRFREIAFYECINGIDQTNIAGTLSDSYGVNLGGFVSLGFGASTTVTVNKAPGQGSRDYCAAVGQAHSRECFGALQSCLNKAEGISPKLLVGELDKEAEAFIARINRVRLGLNGTTAPLAAGGAFRPIARNTTTEDMIFYLTRVKFLANWSEFIERDKVTREQQRKVQLAFEAAQNSFKVAERRLAVLTANYFVPDPSKGKEGERLANLELLRYTRLGEYDRRMKATEKAFKLALVQSVGKRRADKFLELAWKNIYEFGYAEPMIPRQTVN